MLEGRLGAVSAHLCWPQGYHDERYRRVAKEEGFDYLYTVERGSCLPDTNHQHIPRIVTKDRRGIWLLSRLWIYRQPTLATAYLALS